MASVVSLTTRILLPKKLTGDEADCSYRFLWQEYLPSWASSRLAKAYGICNCASTRRYIWTVRIDNLHRLKISEVELPLCQTGSALSAYSLCQILE